MSTVPTDPVAEPAAAPTTTSSLTQGSMQSMQNIGGIMKQISNMAPILITGFLFMTSVFNYDLKALFWIAPLFGWLMLMRMLQSKDKKNEIANTAESCSRLWGIYKSPSLSSFFIMYTLGYIGAPMPVYNDWNVLALLMFLLLFMIDAYVRCSFGCSTTSGVAIGGISGVIIGIFMYFAMTWVGLQSFLYYRTGNTNNEYCSKPKEQNFVCNVYKNGNIISTF